MELRTGDAPVDNGAATRDAQCVRLPDGRRLGYAEFGTPTGWPVFYFHGLPGSRLEAQLMEPAAKKLDIRIVAPDRPGVGRSDPAPRRSLRDWAEDIGVLSDHLGLQRYSVLGVSAGGPYAFACAARLSAGVRNVAVVGGLGSCVHAWARAGIRPHGRIAFWMARNAPWLLRPTFGWVTETVMTRVPRLAFGAVLVGAPSADRRALLRPDVRHILLRSLRESMRNGAAGALQELALFAQPWEFSLAEIAAPVQLWHGEADHVVDVSHSRYHAARLPHARLDLIPDAGHFSLPIESAEAILERLLNG